MRKFTPIHNPIAPLELVAFDDDLRSTLGTVECDCNSDNNKCCGNAPSHKHNHSQSHHDSSTDTVNKPVNIYNINVNPTVNPINTGEQNPYIHLAPQQSHLYAPTDVVYSDSSKIVQAIEPSYQAVQHKPVKKPVVVAEQPINETDLPISIILTKPRIDWTPPKRKEIILPAAFS